VKDILSLFELLVASNQRDYPPIRTLRCKVTGALTTKAPLLIHGFEGGFEGV